MRARYQQELHVTDSSSPDKFSSLQSSLTANPKASTPRIQASRIYLQIVDKYATARQAEIKALLQPLECELNTNDPDLIELSDGKIGLLLQHSSKFKDRHDNEFSQESS